MAPLPSQELIVASGELSALRLIDVAYSIDLGHADMQFLRNLFTD